MRGPRRVAGGEQADATDASDTTEIDLRDGGAVAVREQVARDFAPLGEVLPVGVLGAVGLGEVVYANAAAAVLLGRPAAELTGRGWEAVFHPDDRPELITAVALVLDSTPRQRATLRLAAVAERWVELVVTALGPQEAPTGWVATVDDVSERVAVERRLAHQATHDALTRLPNRTLLVDRLRQAELRMGRADRRSTVVVFYVDLDDFKEVNDRHGHGVGDALLVEVAGRLTRSLRVTDTVARFGGDEFVAACEVDEPDDVEPLRQRLRAALSEPCRLGAVEVPLAASVGVAVADEPDTPIEVLLEVADRDMYVQKAAATAHGGAGA